jgi:hypothetical protein
MRTALRQTDFDEKASGDREQRALVGTGGIVLDIATARIDQHAVVRAGWITSRSRVRHDGRSHCACATA